jgi:formyltetrahydrofolate synthetase
MIYEPRYAEPALCTHHWNLRYPTPRARSKRLRQNLGLRPQLFCRTVIGSDQAPVCMAKTQKSLSDVPRLRGRPKGFRVRVNEVRLSAGAGFVVAICGEMMTMPGLPREPAAIRIKVDDQGNTTGLT